MESSSNLGYKSHLFICTNSPDKPGKCGSKGSEEMRRQLKERCSQSFGKDVRVNASGCLGYCEHGIAAVLYSDDQAPVWQLDLKSTDENALYKLISERLAKK